MFVEFMFAWWWLILIEGLVVAGIIGFIALNAHRLVGDTPRSLLALRSSMAITGVVTFFSYIALIIGVSKLLEREVGIGGVAESIVIFATIISAVLIGFQWLLSPFLINVFYRTRPPETREELQLQVELERLAKVSGIKVPKLRISELSMPNAFAYGSPIAGNYVAVTKGLLRIMPRDEVIAVLGHEVGHLKHRDVAWILALSLIPLAIYFIGRMLIWSGLFSGGSRGRGNNGLILIAVGAALLAASILFRFLVAHFNRLREYYADAHSAMTTGNPRALQRALTRIYLSYKSNQALVEEAKSNEMAAMLFIVAPLVEMSGGFFYDIDRYVDQLKMEEPSPLEEIFATHPPIPKRLRFLDSIALRLQ
ncbi:MAG: zinc metalloprotease HtpX [Desulfurococcales archaeon]|nr:zinc metalloprotease HtpX [Desulfurococcales archaeon]